MEKEKFIGNELPLDNLDLRYFEKCNPKMKVGVNVSRIYIQIAKFCNNPLRKTEIQLLRNALQGVSNKKHVDSRYAIMCVEDIVKCFEEGSNTLPKYTFVPVVTLKGKACSKKRKNNLVVCSSK